MPLTVESSLAILEPMAENFMTPRKIELVRMLHSLIHDNTEAGGSGLGFYHAGTLHTFQPPKETRGQNIGGIAPQFAERADFYVYTRHKLENDIATLQRINFLVAQKAKCYQDLRDTFPDTMIEKSPFLRKMKRIQDEGYLLLKDRGTKVDRLLSIANYYKATQLLGI